MKKLLIVTLIICVLFALNGCAGVPETESIYNGNHENGEHEQGAEDNEYSEQEDEQARYEEHEEEIRRQYPFATGFEKDGFRQYLNRRSVGITTDWFTTWSEGARYDVKHTIMIPKGYVFSSNMIRDADGKRIAQIFPVIRLQENQSMPTKFADIEWCDYTQARLYDAELFSLDGIDVFLWRAAIDWDCEGGGWNYVHKFLMTIGEYVFQVSFDSDEKLPDQDTIDLWLRIVTSIEIVDD